MQVRGEAGCFIQPEPPINNGKSASHKSWENRVSGVVYPGCAVGTIHSTQHKGN